MFSKIRIAFALAFVLALAASFPALAGGWAVIVLDELPANVVAGKELSVGFSVLQHGRTPISGLTPSVSASLSGSKESLHVTAVPEGKTGHYTAVLTFSQAGDWKWSIQAFSMDQPMPTLTVAAPDGRSMTQTNPRPASSISLYLLAGMLGLSAGLIGLLIVFRRRTRWAAAMTVIGLALGVTSLVAAKSPGPAPEAQFNSSSSISQIEIGRQLFVAKGCATCHINSKAQGAAFSVEMGPNLSNYKVIPEYVRVWLSSPASIKPATQMPQLELSPAEIEALIAFLGSE